MELSLKELKDLADDNEIDLSARGLLAVPKTLHMVPRLTHVDLGSNKISTLPNTICSMNQLVRLELGSNAIVHLPYEIGSLTKLQHLDLYNNQLEDLPPTFGNLKALKYLDLKKNPLEDGLRKAAGDCSNDKQCREAAVRVVAHINDRNAAIRVQKEHQEKIKDKIQETKTNEKNTKKKTPPKKGNPKQEQIITEQPKAKVANNGREQKQTSMPEKASSPNVVFSFITSLISLTLRWTFYLAIIALIASTMTVVSDCVKNGGSSVVGNKPLCNEVARLWNKKELPNAKFFTNAKVVYGNVLNGYRMTVARSAWQIRTWIETTNKSLQKNPHYATVTKYMYSAHAFVVEKTLLVQRWIVAKWSQLGVWYEKEGHTYFDSFVKSVRIVANVAFEMTKDLFAIAKDLLTAAHARVEHFVDLWAEHGFVKALEKITA